MNLSLADLVTSTRTERVRDSNAYVHIWRGIYLPISRIPEGTEQWRIRRLISEARALAATLIMDRDNPPILTGEAALILYSIDTWWNTPDIFFRRQCRPTGRSIQEFPAVLIHGVFVPPARLVEVGRPSHSTVPLRMAGVLIEPLGMVAIDCASDLHPLAATVAASGVLRRLSHFNKHSMEVSRAAEADARQTILERTRAQVKERGYRRMRAVLEIADAAVESPGEGALLWTTHCVLHRSDIDADRIVSQQPIRVPGRTYFGDIGFPDQKAIAEFDGYSKVADKEQEQEFITRQRKILAAGWKMVRVELKQFLRPAHLINQFVTELREAGVPSSSPCGPLWVPIPTNLIDLNRRA